MVSPPDQCTSAYCSPGVWRLRATLPNPCVSLGVCIDRLAAIFPIMTAKLPPKPYHMLILCACLQAGTVCHRCFHCCTSSEAAIHATPYLTALQRGMTLAPRVQVYTQLACNAVYGHDVYDHTNHTSSALSSVIPFNSTIHPHTQTYHAFGPLLDEHGTQTMSLHFMSSSSSDNDDEPDPRAVPSKRCLQDSKVMSNAARIQTIMTTTMGLLSALTTGWWGHFGDRYGRTRVLAASTLGLFFTYVIYALNRGCKH